MPRLNLGDANIVVDGNSQTVDVYDTADNWPYQLKHMLRQQGIGVTLTNVGVGAQTTQNMIADASTQVDSLYNPSAENILFVWEMGNDYLLNGPGGPGTLTLAQALENLRSYCLLRRSRGWYIVVCGVPDRVSAGLPNYGTWMLDCDTMIRNSWRGFADAFMDTRRYIPQWVPGGPLVPDGVHANGTCNVYIASYALSVLRQLKKKTKAVIPVPQNFTFTTGGAFGPVAVPSWASRVKGRLVHGGGGGGGGRTDAAGTARAGGGGGGSSSVIEFDLALSDFGLNGTSVLSGNVGVGGSGGLAATANTTSGGNGVSGGISFIRIGASGTVFLVNPGGGYGNGGNGGTNAAGAGGGVSAAGGTGYLSGSSGGSSSVTAAPAGGATAYSAGGGGAGAGITTANLAFAGAAGGRGSAMFNNTFPVQAGGPINGGAGVNGLAISTALPGNGGSGGGSYNTGPGGKGGNGTSGGGGGGGGASTNGFASGAGGKGGDGIVHICFY